MLKKLTLAKTKRNFDNELIKPLMPSIIEGYNYDIFISYRQKDNKGGRLGGPFGGTTQFREAGWVSEFVDSLKTELESTFKEEISVYFDINPHDGLLETHDVDASLKEKLKCLILIPIISRTYCDPKSFAWEHEFKSFVELASQDQFGLKVKLPNGNVASRVLSIRIHDLDTADIRLCESVLGGVLRGVDFIYAEPGVNRPLKPKDSDEKNIKNTNYQNQINKVANSIKEIVRGLKGEPVETVSVSKEVISTIEKPIVQEKSIIVLPFENISPDPDQEYFSDGLTEEIITDLSHIHDLLVISRSSAMTFKGTKKTIPEIAKAVNVRYILEGSVRKSGNNLRIMAQLIDAETDVHLWAEKFSGTLDDVFDIQEKVSRSIVESLKLKINPDENKKISERPIKDVQAYDFYLIARKETMSFTEDGLGKALQIINNGLNIIGDNELLLGAMGWAYFNYFNMGFNKDASCLQKVDECADKIFTLNPNSYLGHWLNALTYWKKGKIKEALRKYKITLKLNSNHTDSLIQLSYFYVISGMTSEARSWIVKLKEIAPLDWLTQYIAGEVETEDGNFEKGLEYLQKMLILASENPFCQFTYAHGLAFVNRFEESYLILDKLAKNTPDLWLGQLALFHKYAMQNKGKEAQQIVSEVLEKALKGDEYCGVFMAEGYALINEADQAIDWLEEVMKNGFINYHYLNEIDPFLENIRGEERFKKLMERVKYEWENFEV
jgi:TolB-like protein/tetratricopeptide (TPR) repeat protein